MTAFPQLDRAAEAAADWINDLTQRLGWHDRDKAYLALIASLHALRDSLPPDEAVFLGNCLTPLLRGLYYEGWHMEREPRFEDRDAVLERIREGVHRDPGIDAEEVARAVFALLAAHLPASELEDVKAVTPKELRAFWPA